MDLHRLSMEMKQKIVSLREFTPLTWPEIAEQCGCSVSGMFFIMENFSWI